MIFTSFEFVGFFLLVLIGIELLETIKAYLLTNVIHVEIVLEVALIAIARKVIIPGHQQIRKPHPRGNCRVDCRCCSGIFGHQATYNAEQ